MRTDGNMLNQIRRRNPKVFFYKYLKKKRNNINRMSTQLHFLTISMSYF